MKREKTKTNGYARLLDAWEPPAGAGAPIGCIATTFTFSSAFFEEECLGRFVQMESDPIDDGPLYLIEREEKLAALRYVGVLVDQRHCRGTRSLRWDLLSARLPKGILHAKISVLFWSNHVRLIIGSANLTDPGFRQNQEVFGCLDYFSKCESPLSVLREVVQFLKECAKYSAEDETEISVSVSRWNALLDQALSKATTWATVNGSYEVVSVRAGLVSPERKSLLKQIQSAWPGGSPPDRAFITSPFFDPPEAKNAPALEMWNLLRQRGGAEITYLVVTEPIAESKGLFIFAPETLSTVKPDRNSDLRVFFEKVEEMVPGENKMQNFRALHMKSIWTQNDKCVSYCFGSSNFTSPGLGLAKNVNLEANLIYTWNLNRAGKIGGLLVDASLSGDQIEDGIKLKWKPRQDEAESEGNQCPVLPYGFRNATFYLDAGKPFLNLSFLERGLPKAWTVRVFGQETALLRAADWKKQKSPKELKIEWTQKHLPVGLEVTWKEQDGWAFWPVNALDGASLPPPDELRNLPLEALIDILLGAGPLHKAMRKWLRKKASEDAKLESKGPTIDPHKRVGVSAFLLQRTRRVSWAFAALRERLSKPYPTLESLEWRLRGPIGVIAVKAAIIREANSDLERMFLLAELALELSRINPVELEGNLEPRLIKRKIREVISEIKREVEPTLKSGEPRMKKYLKAALEEAGG